MNLRKAVLKSFDQTSYTATVQLDGSLKANLEDIAVARNLPASAMTAGRKVVVAFFNETNAKEALVMAVYV